jgi:hypothetical protein
MQARRCHGAPETRAYRLDRYDAMVVVRKRRSAKMLPFPSVDCFELLSPLMTDIVVVSTRPGERMVHPLWISERGKDSWGKGPEDYFIDAFELEDGTAYRSTVGITKRTASGCTGYPRAAPPFSYSKTISMAVECSDSDGSRTLASVVTRTQITETE